jgi:hypothetical protein
MSYVPRYDKGDWKALCDVCGREYKSSQLKQRWDGLMCCHQDWEIRQPQDFVRGVADTQIAPWTRPEPSDYFIPITYNSQIAFGPTNYLSAMKTSLTIGVIRPDKTSPKVINNFQINKVTIG